MLLRALLGGEAPSRQQSRNEGEQEGAGIKGLCLLAVHPHPHTAAAASAVLRRLLAPSASLAVTCSNGGMAPSSFGGEICDDPLRERVRDVTEHVLLKCTPDGLGTILEASQDLLDSETVLGLLLEHLVSCSNCLSQRGTGGRWANKDEGELLHCCVELEVQLISLLALLSSVVMACPKAAERTGECMPLHCLEAVISCQTRLMSEADSLALPLGSVEVTILACTLLAQLSTGALRDEEEHVMGGVTRERMLSIRHCLSSSLAQLGVGQALAYAVFQADCKDVTRRASTLMGLLQERGGADAMVVGDALFSCAQKTARRASELKQSWSRAEAEALCAKEVAELRADEVESIRSQVQLMSQLALAEKEKETRRDMERYQKSLAELESTVEASAEENATLKSKLAACRLSLLAAEEGASRGRTEANRSEEAARKAVHKAGRLESKVLGLESEMRVVRREWQESAAMVESKSALVEELRQQVVVLDREVEALKVDYQQEKALVEQTEGARDRALSRAEEAFSKLITLAQAYKDLEEGSEAERAEARRVQAGLRAEVVQLKEQEGDLRGSLEELESDSTRTIEALSKAREKVATLQAELRGLRLSHRAAEDRTKVLEDERRGRIKEVADLTRAVEGTREELRKAETESRKRAEELEKRTGIMSYINKLSSDDP
ncbi:unnamed protein product [Chrysoparadoxa australica]